MARHQDGPGLSHRSFPPAGAPAVFCFSDAMASLFPGNGGAVNAAVALARGVVYVASFDGTLYAIGSGKLPAETDVPVSKPPFEPSR